MADFISGADLVARGAEGTGAAVVLNNQPTIQNLARLGSRMDNLYKTQEMLKLKLAAAKQPKPEKQPSLNPFATKGVLSENLNTNVGGLIGAYNDLARNDYNQALANNDNIGANQVVADVASVYETLQPAATNFDNSIKEAIESNKGFYQNTQQVVRNIANQFPRIDPNEWNKLTDPADRKKLIAQKINDFRQTNPQEIIQRSLLGDESSYDYSGINQEAQKTLVNNSISSGYSGATSKQSRMTYNELFNIDREKQTASLNYNKARRVIAAMPKAEEQIQYVMAVAGNKVEQDPDNKLKSQAQLEKMKNDAMSKKAKEYIDNVFGSNLKIETEREIGDPRAAAEAIEKGKNADELISTGPIIKNRYTGFKQIDQELSRKTGKVEYIKETDESSINFGKDKIFEEDYPVEFTGTRFAYKQPKHFEANTVFIPMSRMNNKDQVAMKATKYQNNFDNNLYVMGRDFEANEGTITKDIPVFVTAFQYYDKKTGEPKVYPPGTWVPRDMLKETLNGKPLLDKTDYYEASGTVVSPQVSYDTGVEGLGAGKEQMATTEIFIPDQQSQNVITRLIAKNKKAKQTIFDKK